VVKSAASAATTAPCAAAENLRKPHCAFVALAAAAAPRLRHMRSSARSSVPAAPPGRAFLARSAYMCVRARANKGARVRGPASRARARAHVQRAAARGRTARVRAGKHACGRERGRAGV
jgi:hypothetical protein